MSGKRDDPLGCGVVTCQRCNPGSAAPSLMMPPDTTEDYAEVVNRAVTNIKSAFKMHKGKQNDR